MEFEGREYMSSEEVAPLANLERVETPRISFLNLAQSDPYLAMADISVGSGMLGLFWELINNKNLESPITAVCVIVIAYGLFLDKLSRDNP